MFLFSDIIQLVGYTRKIVKLWLPLSPTETFLEALWVQGGKYLLCYFLLRTVMPAFGTCTIINSWSTKYKILTL